MAVDDGAPEAGKLFRAWTSGRRKKERVTKERAVQRVHSRALQNERRGVLGRMTADAL